MIFCMCNYEENTPIIKIELKDLIKYIYTMLDYNVKDYASRKNIIDKIQNEIGEQINAHLHFCENSNLNDYKVFTVQQHINNIFEIMTDYLFNSKDITKGQEYKFYSADRLKDGSAKNFISLESYISDVMSSNENIYKHYDDNNNATYKIENFIDDMKQCDFINDYIEFNKVIRNIIETHKYNDREYTEKEISVLKKSIGYCKNNSIEIDKDIITLYKMYKGFIYFKQPLKESTCPSYEYFDFDDVNQILSLLKFKGEGNFDSDLGCLIYDLNSVINQTKFTKNEMNILNLYRKYDLTLEDIAKELNVTKQYISDRLQNICKKISEQFWIDYENWYYTYVAKGNYKTCPICRETKLANENYFGINKRNKDGLHKVCKICRNNATKYIDKSIPQNK